MEYRYTTRIMPNKMAYYLFFFRRFWVKECLKSIRNHFRRKMRYDLDRSMRRRVSSTSLDSRLQNTAWWSVDDTVCQRFRGDFFSPTLGERLTKSPTRTKPYYACLHIFFKVYLALSSLVCACVGYAAYWRHAHRWR